MIDSNYLNKVMNNIQGQVDKNVKEIKHHEKMFESLNGDIQSTYAKMPEEERAKFKTAMDIVNTKGKGVDEVKMRATIQELLKMAQQK